MKLTHPLYLASVPINSGTPWHAGRAATGLTNTFGPGLCCPLESTHSHAFKGLRLWPRQQRYNLTCWSCCNWPDKHIRPWAIPPTWKYSLSHFLRFSRSVPIGSGTTRYAALAATGLTNAVAGLVPSASAPSSICYSDIMWCYPSPPYSPFCMRHPNQSRDYSSHCSQVRPPQPTYLKVAKWQ